MPDDLQYLDGFRNHHQTEAESGALPVGQNSPQRPRLGLYAEQVTGSSFTAPRSHNLKSWLYRILPSVVHSEFEPLNIPEWQTPPFVARPTPPTQLRWGPRKMPPQGLNFLQGVYTMCGHGSPGSSAGASIHLYQFDKGMGNQFFYSADSEIMLVPYEGELVVDTEYGVIACQPKEIIVVPRGCKFQVNGRQKSKEGRYCGYMIENFGAPFQLPELGPIGANGLANARDFKIPVARYQDQTLSCQLICKFEGSFYSASMEHHPLNVVAWHGNYYPYKYDLTRFNTIGSVSFDHPDPSIFTVLTSPTERTGFANVDFVIFPERWMVAENTFRPPYYHRNLMSEFMGLIEGIYDAKPSGFVKGGGSLHNRMSAHGPDRDSFEHATTSELRPEKQTQTLGFMWESLGVWSVTDQALSAEFRQRDYVACWKGLESRFQK